MAADDTDRSSAKRGQTIESIERSLEETCHGLWRRCAGDEINLVGKLRFTHMWRIDLPSRLHLHPLVDHLLLCIDIGAVFTEPRIIAPQADMSMTSPWPHVEPMGLLCLPKTSFESPLERRSMTCLQNALDLLRMPDAERDNDLRREFLAYWAQHSCGRIASSYALIEETPSNREVFFYEFQTNRLIFAEDEETLNRWLERVTGYKPSRLGRTRMIALDRPPTPDEFPQSARDVYGQAGFEGIERYLPEGEDLPILLSCAIEDSYVFAGIALLGASLSRVRRGFRPSAKVPPGTLRRFFKYVDRFPVQRADSNWVHGRDANESIATLRRKSVAIIGCGALGSTIATLLTKEGTGSILLVDPDQLKPENVSRHELGIETVGQYKAMALGERIKRELPHIRDVCGFAHSVEYLQKDDLDKVMSCDLIVTAAISLEGDSFIEACLSARKTPPLWLCTWIEEFAVAGHALLIPRSDRLLSKFNQDGTYKYRLTYEWPEQGGEVPEPGCASTFQPYNMSDAQASANMAARLALDALLGRVTSSVNRQWHGDREIAISYGAKLDPSFSCSFRQRERKDNY